MIASGVAKRYAQALFMVAEESQRIDAVAEELDRAWETIERQADLKQLFYGVQFSQMDKKVIMKKIFKDDLSRDVLNFLLLLIEKSRYAFLPDIRTAYHALRDQHLGIHDVTVYSAFPLTEEKQEDIRKALGQTEGKIIRLNVKEDASLLAGIRVQIGDTIIDGSAKARLEKMRKQLLNNRK